MKVENLKNYGKDIISIQKESKLPFNKKLLVIKPTISFLLSLIKEMSPSGFIRFIKVYKKEKAGQEKNEISIDTEDCFQLNITYCVY